VEPERGLREGDFRKICENGFGDGHNSYAYSMAWFRDRLYVGTSRANLCLLKFAMPFVKIDVWPVECPYPNYTPEFEHRCARGEIWRYAPETGVWTRAYQSPLVTDADGVEFSRELGYRGMTVYQGPSDPAPALYVATWSRSRGKGPQILRSEDGESFALLPPPDFRVPGREVVFNAIRSLIPFRGKLYTAPAGATKGNVNNAGVALVYECEDPLSGEWRCVNEPFGEFPEVATVYEMAVFDDWLYVGTGGLQGFQIWRTRAEGRPPYRFEKVMDRGAGRGALNQGSVAMVPFKGALYIGTGIQNGGFDWRNKVGPAAAEVLRVFPDGSWDVVAGNKRPDREPISGLNAGFGNFFSSYLWRMGVHDGWLYAGTMDWSIILRFTQLEKRPYRATKILSRAGVEGLLETEGGFDLWRTCDGEDWMCVTRRGFGNMYNFGCRTLVSTPRGLFVGTANPFGPRVAACVNKEWTYVDNPRGGLEVWLGGRDVTGREAGAATR
jgi:hypothetical protein